MWHRAYHILNVCNASVFFVNTPVKNILNVFAFSRLLLIILLPSFKSGMVRG